MAWAGTESSPGPFNFRGCDLTAEWLLAKEHVRVRLPATAPIFKYAERQLARPSLQNLSLLGAAPRRRANLHMGSWQTSNAPALQAG